MSTYNLEIKCIDFSDAEIIENVSVEADNTDEVFRKAYYDMGYGKIYSAMKYKVVSWKPTVITQ